MAPHRNGSRKASRREPKKKRTERVVFADSPPIPPGAVPADRSQQVPWGSYDPQPLFYVDRPFTCVDCGHEEVWTAAQQKWYYEVAKGSLYGKAIRCRQCRQLRRGEPKPIS